MATSGDSDEKILFSIKKQTPWIQSDAPLKKYAHKKNISFKEKGLINKVKCFTENNGEVWRDRKLLFWLAKNLWVETKQLTKFSQNVDLIYKRSNTIYLKILATKYLAFLGNQHLLC